MIEPKYSTGWSRFKAASIDSSLIITINTFLAYLPLTIFRRSPYAAEFFAIITLLLPYFYSIFQHGKWGSTIGKSIYGLRVLDGSEEKRITWAQAIARDALPLFIQSAITLSYFMTRKLDLLLQDTLYGTLNTERTDISTVLLILMSGLWSALELLTMMFNGKRRALHDLIAKTVVINEGPRSPISLHLFWSIVLGSAFVRMLLQTT